MKAVKSIVTRCISEKLIDNSQVPWFLYILENKIYSLITFIALLIIGSYMSSFSTTFSFLLSFIFLRCRTSGYHAKTFSRCFMFSILVELFSLLIVLPFLAPLVNLLLIALSTVVIFKLAPYNHPYMHLSFAEVIACARDAKLRVLILSLLVLIFSILNCNEVAHGIVLGITTTSCSLIIAYIKF